MNKPRANWLVLSAAVLASLLPILLLIACVTAPRSEDVPPEVRVVLFWPWSLAVAVFPALWLIGEYLSLVRRSRVSAGCLGFPLFWLAVIGPFSLAYGALSVAGVLPPDREWTSWWDVLIMLVFVACLGYAAYGHAVWWVALRQAEKSK